MLNMAIYGLYTIVNHDKKIYGLKTYTISIYNYTDYTLQNMD
jgi:hypothetical protein